MKKVNMPDQKRDKYNQQIEFQQRPDSPDANNRA